MKKSAAQLRAEFNRAARLQDNRLQGSEALMEQWLRTTRDDDLAPVVYRLHLFAVEHKDKGFYHLGKYFSQGRDALDEATDLFRKHRKKLCRKQGDDYDMLQLFLLYDCLIHVGSQRCGERTMGYLETPHRHEESLTLKDVLTDKDYVGKALNFVVIGGEVRIRDKNFHHSELSDGKPVEAAGEMLILPGKNGKLRLVVNGRSGHYRPPEEEGLERALLAVRRELAGLPKISVTVESVREHIVEHLPKRQASKNRKPA